MRRLGAVVARRPAREAGRASALVYVGGEVLREVVRPGEALTAHLAVVGPLAGVDAQVAREVALAAEGPPAEEADERPLARVLAHVELEVLLGAHALAAEGAGEAPLAPLGRLVVVVVVVVVVVAGRAVHAQVQARLAGAAGLGQGLARGLGALLLRAGVLGVAARGGPGPGRGRLAGLGRVVPDAGRLGAGALLARGLQGAVAAGGAVLGLEAQGARVAGAARLQLGGLARARDLVAALGVALGLARGGALQALQRVVQAVLLKGLEVPARRWAQKQIFLFVDITLLTFFINTMKTVVRFSVCSDN